MYSTRVHIASARPPLEESFWSGYPKTVEDVVINHGAVPRKNPAPLAAVADLGRRLIPFPDRMLALFVVLFAALRSSVPSHLELELEILALRHQLAVLRALIFRGVRVVKGGLLAL